MNELTEDMSKAITKIFDELASAKDNNMPKEYIADYLAKLCGKSEAFALLVLDPSKSFGECLKNAYNIISKKLSGRNGNVPDQEVYDLCAQYFVSDQTEATLITHADDEGAELSDSAKALLEKAEANKTNQITKKPINLAKEREQRPAKKPDGPVGQMSLFDLGGAF